MPPKSNTKEAASPTVDAPVDPLDTSTKYAFLLILAVSLLSFVLSTFVLDLSHIDEKIANMHNNFANGGGVGGSFASVPMTPDEPPVSSPPSPSAAFNVLNNDQRNNVPANIINLKRIQRSASGPSYPWNEAYDKTIFMSVASYRDEECKVTAENLFMRASNPRRLFLGIFEQNDYIDPICVPDGWKDCDSPDFCPIDNLRRKIVSSLRGKGPCYARYIAALLFRGENYFFVIDSHMVWNRHWDTKALAHLYRSRSSRPVLSHYPNTWDKNDTEHEAAGRVMVMCNAEFNHSLHFTKNVGCWFDRKMDPFPVPFAAAGYLYGDSRMIYEVPMDPYLEHLFDGEEVMFSTRLFSHGFDLFSPGENVVYHNYHRGAVKRWWDENKTKGAVGPSNKWRGMAIPAQRRVQYFLKANKFPGSTQPLVDQRTLQQIPNITAEEEKYGLGKARSLEEFEHFAMIDLKANRADLKFCFNITRSKEHL